MSITQSQIPGALTTIGQLNRTLQSINNLLNEAEILILNGWVVTLAPGVTLSITPDQQASLVSQYDTLKADLVTIFSQLP